MKVIERVTQGNFFAEGYLRVNPDIADYVQKGGDAWQHFVNFGEREGRSQISRIFTVEKDRYGRAKFERFKNRLMINSGGGAGPTAHAIEEFKFLDNDGAFPVVASDRHFSRADYATESSNGAYPPFVEAIVANSGGLFLDLGCGLRDEVFENCLYLEVYPSLTADMIVAPDCRYPIKSRTFDGIGCFAVLEHVTRPWQVAAEIRRMLKPGGRVYICWPFLQPIHGYPSHYYNATRAGLELMFSDGFDIEFCRTEPSESPDYTISWVLGKFVDSLPPAKKERVLQMKVTDLLAQPRSGAFWSDLLEGLPDEVISEFACGNTLVATKR